MPPGENNEDDIDVLIDCLNARILCAISEASCAIKNEEEDRPDQLMSSIEGKSPWIGEDDIEYAGLEQRPPEVAFGGSLPDDNTMKQSSSVIQSERVQELSDEIRRQRIEISRLVRLLSTKQTEIDRLNRTIASKEEPEEISTADMTIIKRQRASRFRADDSQGANLAIMPTPRPKPERSCENHCIVQ